MLVYIAPPTNFAFKQTKNIMYSNFEKIAGTVSLV